MMTNKVLGTFMTRMSLQRMIYILFYFRYEISPEAQLSIANKDRNVQFVQVLQRDIYAIYSSFVGFPLLITFSSSTTNRQIFNEIWIRKKRFLKEECSSDLINMKILSQNGSSCGKCSQLCEGCPLIPNDEIISFKNSMISVVIEWKPQAKSLYEKGEEMVSIHFITYE